MGDPTVLRAKPARTILQSEIALSRLLQFITSIPDPDMILQKVGIKRHHLRQLTFDDEVAQAVDTRVEAVISTPWRLEPNQTRIGKRLTLELEPHIEDLVRGVMDARFYGYSVFEIIYRQTPQGIGINRLALKPMEWFEPQRDGSLLYFPDDGSAAVEGIPCHPLKFLLARCNATYRNPYGESLLSRLWFPVTWRREGWGLWLQFLETFGEPIVLGQVRNYQDFVDAMTLQGVRSTVAWEGSGDDKIETINASTPGEFERLENAIIKRIQKLILGQTLTSDVGSNGSYAVAAIHNEVRNDKRRADLRLVRGIGQRVVDYLSLLNGFEPPRFVLADDAGLETPRAQRDAILAPVLKSSSLQLTRAYYLRHYDYLDEDIEEIEDEPAAMEEADPMMGEVTDTPSNADSNDLPDPVKDRSVTDETD